jgi:pimeloyl-ACP methyl ester carboxylesterase
MKGIAAAVKKGDFDILRGAGHLLNLEQPAAFKDKVLTFLKRRVL